MGLDAETLTMILDAIRGFAAGRLPDERLLELDAHDEFPADVVRGMCGEELGIQLLFIPEVHGGMGGDAVDVYRVCEQMAAIDLGVATGVLATFLGSEPILVGGTPTSGCGRGASGPPRIDGTAVLPGVMGIEGFAELAGLVLSGWRVAADCELGSVRQLAGRPEPQVATHFTGRVRLSRAAPAEPPGDAPPGPAGTAVDEAGRVLVRLEGYSTVELPAGPEPELLASLRAAMA